MGVNEESSQDRLSFVYRNRNSEAIDPLGWDLTTIQAGLLDLVLTHFRDDYRFVGRLKIVQSIHPTHSLSRSLLLSKHQLGTLPSQLPFSRAP